MIVVDLILCTSLIFWIGVWISSTSSSRITIQDERVFNSIFALKKNIRQLKKKNRRSNKLFKENRDKFLILDARIAKLEEVNLPTSVEEVEEDEN